MHLTPKWEPEQKVGSQQGHMRGSRNTCPLDFSHVEGRKGRPCTVVMFKIFNSLYGN